MAASADQRLESTGARQDAETVGLIYVDAAQPGFARRRAGRGFAYRGLDQKPVRDVAILKRVRDLAVPPAWSSVWICASPLGHIQAIGYDAKGRKQYCYHPGFRDVRDGAKFEHLLTVAHALPILRERVASDMAKRGLAREKVLATVVHLLETTMIRIGNSAYARAYDSYGLTTLTTRHIKIEGAELKFRFKGKSGKVWRLDVQDRRVANIVRQCQELPGQTLFQYLDENGGAQAVTSADVNGYLKRVSGHDISAKDFRTWTATVLAGFALAALEPCAPPQRARAVSRVVRWVAARLGNTPTVCRQCYTHPAVIEAYLNGTLRVGITAPEALEIDHELGELGRLSAAEGAVLNFLEAASAVHDAGAVSQRVRDAAAPER